MNRSTCSIILLDRDGTIIEDPGYPKEPSAVTLIPGALEGLRLMQEKGYPLFVISNQSGVGRGIISRKEFEAVHKRFDALLREAGVEIARYLYCIHHPDEGCDCRKPKTGSVPKTHGTLPIDFSSSFVIGDREGDIGLGNNLGATTYLLETGAGKETAQILKTAHASLEYHIRSTLLDIAKEIPGRKESEST